jgi:hypothetical protein
MASRSRVRRRGAFRRHCGTSQDFASLALAQPGSAQPVDPEGLDELLRPPGGDSEQVPSRYEVPRSASFALLAVEMEVICLDPAKVAGW